MTRDDLLHGLEILTGKPPYPPMVDYIVEFVAEWLENRPLPADAAEWRKEMDSYQ